MVRRLLLAAGVLTLVAPARADEIRLKDGSKIVGTIVDFESDSFKVQTAYGFAMVRKDSIAQIIPDAPAKAAEPAKAPAAPSAPSIKPATAPASAPSVKPDLQPAVSRNAAPSASPAAAATPVQPPAATVLPMPAPNPKPASPAPVAAIAPAAPPAPASPPATPPEPMGPPPIRESVTGNLYTNETYSFQFYRPPGWEVLPEARKALPNAITAMGTSDQTTLFVVGREPVKDSLEAQAGSAERALQWRFRGIADGHDWSVTALTIARGADVFTLLGMTYADSDLIQIRENVIARMISSLQFKQPPQQ